MVDVTEDHSLLTTDMELIKPQDSINRHLLCKDIPIEMLKNQFKNMAIFKSFSNQTEAQKLQILYEINNIKLKLSYRDEEEKFIFENMNNDEINDNNKVIKVIEILDYPENEFVYDLETECGRFQAGVGNIIVKNTDSNFYKCNIPDQSKMSKEEMIKKTMDIGEMISQEVNKAIAKPGIMNFAYEKVAYPLLLVKKKGYYFRKYEDDPKKFKEVAMGLATKRRNYCSFSKNIYQQLLTKLMESASPDSTDVSNFIVNELNKLINNQVSLDELKITKSLKETYANPDGTAHWVLAQKMRERGQTVNSNDRIAFIFSLKKPTYNTLGNQIKCKDAEIIEELEYAKEHNILYDPEKYISGQIREPISQILEFITEDNQKIFDEAIIKCRQRKIEIFGSPEIPKRKKK